MNRAEARAYWAETLPQSREDLIIAKVAEQPSTTSAIEDEFEEPGFRSGKIRSAVLTSLESGILRLNEDWTISLNVPTSSGR